MESSVVLLLILVTITFTTVPISNVTLTAQATNLVAINDTAVLMCSVSNGTSLSYVWLMNNTVVSGENVQLSNGNATLTIAPVTRHYKGAFNCEVSNGISNASSPPVFLNISYGPSNTTMSILPSESDHIYRTGSNLTLSCSALSSPAATTEWMVDGKALNKSGPWIHLNNASESDSGNYKCVLHNAVTSRFSSANPLEAVKVNRVGGPAILNKSFTLHCEVTGTVNRIKWWRNWQMIVHDNTTIIENKTLTLNAIQHSDNGDYNCQAFNSVSNMTSSPYVVMVNYGPGMPTIMGPSLVKAGLNVTLTCNASSHPPAHYRWYFNDSLMAETAMFVTPRLTEDMTGNYTCMVYNNITGQNKTTQKMLTVVDPITDVQVETPMDPPKEGHPYTLTCNVTGPADHVYWNKYGPVQHVDSEYTFPMNNKTLGFNPLYRNDTGYYKCVAVNAVGNMTSPPHELIVNFGPETPVISGPRHAETGDVVSFNCSSTSVPSSRFSWWFNGTEVSNTSMFTSEPLLLNMSGEYTCMAYNHVTGKNSSVSTMLTVVEAIVSVKISNSTSPISSENFTLTCEVTGPYNTIYWMKNNTVLDMNDMNATEYRIENNMLHFTPVTTDNDGTYQCVATNMVVQFKSPMYTLLVNYGPLSMAISGPVVGQDFVVELTCSADSRPDCDFFWYLNNNSSAVIKTGSTIVLPATLAQSGNYICVARNPVTMISMYRSKSINVPGGATAVHFSSGGGLMMMCLFAVFVPVLFT
ncbi:carcinoembryonic antigen-related cell adhesion molecule 1 [Limanda limanda]|uniref:carcinoembryonic antigen-related cell adhesion molecule 1 n=1 Tax=Limanda limanda TaxID=27771 RepID=UPI0029C99361|nr:carcinoembryonic antigen-related cell adhesion molecule 1 [Limanda limanda]